MKILAIDTATKYLSLAIVDNDRILAGFHEKEDMKHSSLLIPTIDKLLKKCNLKLKDIDAIALSIGPGSFTGLRIGVATCKGINLALGIPIVAVPTLDAIAYNFIPCLDRLGMIRGMVSAVEPSDQRETCIRRVSTDEKERVLCPLIDAKKQKVYASFYRRKPPANQVGSEGAGLGGGILQRVTDYMLLDIESLLKKIDKPTLVFGDAIKLYGERCEENRLVRISTKDWYPKAEIVAKLGLAKALKRQFTNPDKLAPMYLHSKYCQVKI